MEAPLIVILGDVIEGGAATSTGRLIQALTNRGLRIERWHFSHQPASAPANYVSLDNRRKRPPFERFFKNISRHSANSLRRTRHEAALKAQLQKARPALVNVRNIHDCGLNHASLLDALPGIPIVWTMHDCWPFNVHSFEWHNSALGRSETTASDGPTWEAANERRRAFFQARPDVVLASPSTWLAAEARLAVPAAVRVEVLPNGLPTEVFLPISKPEARQLLGLSHDKVWLSFGSTWANSRKGTDVLLNALQKVDCTRLGLVSWGGQLSGNFPATLEQHHFGSIYHERLLALLYSASDLFACPSRADNLPNTILEALACGTPVIGSRIGGIPDMVRPGQTGWLYEGDSPDNCAVAIRQALAERNQWTAYQQNARKLAVEEFDVQKGAERYAKLYAELLAH